MKPSSIHVLTAILCALPSYAEKAVPIAVSDLAASALIGEAYSSGNLYVVRFEDRK